MRALLLFMTVGCLLSVLACHSTQPDRYAQDPRFGNCINALRMIQGAKEQWGLEHHASSNAIPTVEDLQPYLFPGSPTWKCPAGGAYTLGRVCDPVTCSFGGPGHVLQ